MSAPRKTNPAPAFGSAERARAMKGLKKVSGKSGARAKKRRDRGAKRKAQDHAEKTFQRLSMKEAAGEKLTKAQMAALKRHEPAALRSAGLSGTDAEVLAEAERLSQEHAREEAAYTKAVARILGSSGTTSAVKISRADGTPFQRQELAGLQSVGWQIHPGGTIAAQLGKSLKGYRTAINPTDALTRALGPEGETRAVVIAAPGINEDTLHHLRGAGYDLSTAPKRLREAESSPDSHHGKALAAALGTKGKDAKRMLVWSEAADRASRHAEKTGNPKDHYIASSLHLAASASHHQAWEDSSHRTEGHHAAWMAHHEAERHHTSKAGTARVSPKELIEATKRFRSAEVKTNPEITSGAAQRRVYEALRKGASAPSDIARMAKVAEPEVEAALGRLQGLGLAHVVRQSMFGWEWAPGALQPGLAFNPKPGRQVGPRAATAAALAGQPGRMKKTAAKKGPKKTAPKVAKKPAAATAAPAKVQALRTPAAMKHLAITELGNLLKGKPAQEREEKGPKPKPTLEKFTLTGRFNPTSGADLAQVWRAWTGTEPNQTITFDVQGAKGIPAKVVVLGRVAKLITKTGRIADFGASGPLMVTDAKAERVWLLGEKPFHFDLEPSVITYLARKPKFGDRGTVEYVHGFKGRTRAVMAGQIGTLTGQFKITHRGLED